RHDAASAAAQLAVDLFFFKAEDGIRDPQEETMVFALTRVGVVATVLAAMSLSTLVGAAEIGQIKTAKGQVTIERDGRTLSGTVGARLQSADVVKTGADSS